MPADGSFYHLVLAFETHEPSPGQVTIVGRALVDGSLVDSFEYTLTYAYPSLTTEQQERLRAGLAPRAWGKAHVLRLLGSPSPPAPRLQHNPSGGLQSTARALLLQLAFFSRALSTAAASERFADGLLAPAPLVLLPGAWRADEDARTAVQLPLVSMALLASTPFPPGAAAQAVRAAATRLRVARAPTDATLLDCTGAVLATSSPIAICAGGAPTTTGANAPALALGGAWLWLQPCADCFSAPGGATADPRFSFALALCDPDLASSCNFPDPGIADSSSVVVAEQSVRVQPVNDAPQPIATQEPQRAMAGRALLVPLRANDSDGALHAQFSLAAAVLTSLPACGALFVLAGASDTGESSTALGGPNGQLLRAVRADELPLLLRWPGSAAVSSGPNGSLWLPSVNISAPMTAATTTAASSSPSISAQRDWLGGWRSTIPSPLYFRFDNLLVRLCLLFALPFLATRNLETYVSATT
jgi:hypothetical protein